MDASFVEVPRQRNTKKGNSQIKSVESEALWNENPWKKPQKDIDGRWTEKNNETHYGYKDHIRGDTKGKLIKTRQVTDASVHDSQPMKDLLEDSDKEEVLHADSDYSGEPMA
jgi:IS5 family transposase